LYGGVTNGKSRHSHQEVKSTNKYFNLIMTLRISTKLAVGFCALLLFAEVGFAQKPNTVWPYGGVPDTSEMDEEMKKPPLNFNKMAYFYRAKFDDEAHFSGATFGDRANFSWAKFDDEAHFSGATFGDGANFGWATFDDEAHFSGATFGDRAEFGRAKFGDGADFYRAKFDSVANFYRAKFDSVANFSWATFDDEAHFGEATFDDGANFREATFDDRASFFDAKFNDEVDFEHASFMGTVNFAYTDFRQGVDFRQTYFDSVEIIHLENMTFPEGKLRFYWHQFQGKDNFRIKLLYPPADSLKQEHYNRIEIIYHQLRDTFLAQGDSGSADAVMYELGLQKNEILGEFWWRMYGLFFGWGYQPWRFLLFVVLPTIVGFAVLWYFKYYEVLQKVIFKTELKAAAAFKEKQDDLLQKVWHSLFFSSSVLLGIRFKKAWIIKRGKFLYWASFEWATGIILIVAFALLVKGARFGFIRDLLGF